MPEGVSPGDVVKTGGLAAVALTALVGLVSALINILPNKITAQAAARQQENEEGRKLRDELEEICDRIARERDRAISERDEATRRGDHWEREARRLESQMVRWEAFCSAHNYRCYRGDQRPVTVEPLHPYTPHPTASPLPMVAVPSPTPASSASVKATQDSNNGKPTLPGRALPGV